MKLNICIGSPPRNGWLNLDPLTNPNDPQSGKIVHQDLTNLDSMVDNNECDEVVALEVLDIFPQQMKEQVCKHWMAKVAHAGVFTISGVDLDKVSNVMYFKHISDEQLNLLLYGQGTNMYTLKKGLWNVQKVVDVIMSTNQFKILRKEIDGVNYIITAERL